MSGHESDHGQLESRLTHWRPGPGPAGTPVDAVIRRGRRLRTVRRGRRVGLAAAGVIGAGAVVAVLVALPGSGQPARVVVGAGGTPAPAAPAPALIPLGGGCAGGDSTAAPAGRAVRVSLSGSPVALTATSVHASVAANCATPPLAALLGRWAPGHEQLSAVVAVWGPGAAVTAAGAGPTAAPSAGAVSAPVTVRGAAGEVSTTAGVTSYSWQEPDGSRWIATANGVPTSQVVALLDRLALLAGSASSTVPPGGAGEFTPIPISPAPAAGSQALVSVTHFQGSAGDVDATVYDNAVAVTGPELGAVGPLAGLRFVAVAGHKAVIGANGPDTNFLSWRVNAHRSVLLFGDLSSARLQQMAAHLQLE